MREKNHQGALQFLAQSEKASQLQRSVGQQPGTRWIAVTRHYLTIRAQLLGELYTQRSGALRSQSFAHLQVLVSRVRWQ